MTITIKITITPEEMPPLTRQNAHETIWSRSATAHLSSADIDRLLREPHDGPLETRLAARALTEYQREVTRRASTHRP